MSLSLQLNFEPSADFKDLDNTVNYEQLHQMVKEIMLVPQKLIEGLTKDIYTSIKAKYPEILGVNVKVVKKNPPLKMVGQTTFEITDF